MSNIVFKAISIKQINGESFHYNCESQAIESLNDELFAEAKILYIVDGQAAMVTFTDVDALRDELS